MATPSQQRFLDAKLPRLTLIGMSGSGKTKIGTMLAQQGWALHSVDYRIGNHYLKPAIIEDFKTRISTALPTLKRLIERDKLRLDFAMAPDSIEVLSEFVGMFGNPQKGGLSRSAFQTRQRLYAEAEKKAMLELPAMIADNDTSPFVCDSTGSVCEIIDIDDPNDSVLRAMVDQSFVLYLRVDDKHEATLIEHQLAAPKPMLFSKPFFEKHCASRADDDPRELLRDMFPKLLAERRHHYEKLAALGGTTIDSAQAHACRHSEDLLKLIAEAQC